MYILLLYGHLVDGLVELLGVLAGHHSLWGWAGLGRRPRRGGRLLRRHPLCRNKWLSQWVELFGIWIQC